MGALQHSMVLINVDSTCAGTLQLGLAMAGVAPPPMGTPAQPHPALAALAQLYAPPPAQATENGGPMLQELSGAVGSPLGLEDAVTHEWQRLRSLRLQNVHA